MAKTPFESSISPAESSTAAMFSRNDDPMTLALRAEGDIDINGLIGLHQRASSPSYAGPSTTGTRTTTVFSARQQSSGTKPTSAGTSYPLDDYRGKGKAIAEYASSLSATHGSGSEAEAEQEAIRDNTLFGVGGWTAAGRSVAPPLKGPTRARRQPRMNRRRKDKKPVVIIQQNGESSGSEGEETLATEQVPRRHSRESKYLRQRRYKPEPDQLHLAEEGRALQSAADRPSSKPLSRIRIYILISLIITIGLTLAFSVLGAHYTGKTRFACTKGIIFAATVLISGFTVLAMVVARRAVQEALLAGLLEFLVGFGLLIEIHDFMRP